MCVSHRMDCVSGLPEQYGIASICIVSSYAEGVTIIYRRRKVLMIGKGRTSGTVAVNGSLVDACRLQITWGFGKARACRACSALMTYTSCAILPPSTLDAITITAQPNTNNSSCKRLCFLLLHCILHLRHVSLFPAVLCETQPSPRLSWAFRRTKNEAAVCG